MSFRRRIAGLALLLLAGCSVAAPPRDSYVPRTADPDVREVVSVLQVLASHMDDPLPPQSLAVRMLATDEVNAANGGDGTFYFTEGLVRTRDERLIRGIVAHELAHQDLNHVRDRTAASSMVSAAFTAAGFFIPGVGYLDYVANPIISSAYGRTQELAADRHALVLMERAFVAGGQPPAAAHAEAAATMAYALRYLYARYGEDEGGGLLASHPGIVERIRAVEDPAG
ncbi:MAG: M48 family metalloprotease [Alphaproteobacteria bacterium]